MKILNHIKILDENQLGHFTKLVSTFLYRNSTNLFYEGQIPHVGFLIVEGDVTFYSKEEQLIQLGVGSLFGVKELMEHIPLNISVKISPNTRVAILDRSTILDILKLKDKKLYPIINNILS